MINRKQLLEESRHKLELLKQQRLKKQQELTQNLEYLITKDTEKLEKVLEVTDVDNNSVDQEATDSITAVLPSSFQKPQEVVYFTKSTNTDDLQTVVEIQNRSETEVNVKELRRQIELELRGKLETEYQKAYETLLSNKEKQTEELEQNIEEYEPISYHQSVIDELSKLQHPKRAAAYVSNMYKDQFITVNQDYYIYVWQVTNLEPKLLHSIKSSSKITSVQFTLDGSIIAGSASGKLYLYGYDDKLHLYFLLSQSSKLLYSPIIAIYSTKETFIIVTRKAELCVIATNLNDTITPAKLPLKDTIVTQAEFVDSSRVILGDLKGDVYLIDIGTLDTIQLFHTEDLLPVISLKYRPTSVSGIIAFNNLQNTIYILDINSRATIQIPLQSFAIDLEWVEDQLVIAVMDKNNKSKIGIWLANDERNYYLAKSQEEELFSKLKLLNSQLVGFKADGASIIVQL